MGAALSFLQLRLVAREQWTGLRETVDLSVLTDAALTPIHPPGVATAVGHASRRQAVVLVHPARGHWQQLIAIWTHVTAVSSQFDRVMTQNRWTALYLTEDTPLVADTLCTFVHLPRVTVRHVTSF